MAIIVLIFGATSAVTTKSAYLSEVAYLFFFFFFFNERCTSVPLITDAFALNLSRVKHLYYITPFGCC